MSPSPKPQEHDRLIYPMGSIRQPTLIHQEQVVYPPAALANKLEGRVIVEVVIDESGRVELARIIQSPNPVFNQAALDAVRKFQYSPPIKESGEKVAVYWFVTVNFTLPK